AQLLHLPPGEHKIMEFIPHLKQGQRSLQPNELNEGIRVGTLQHPIQKERKVKIPDEQFTKHLLISGQTGSGKTSVVMEITQSMIDRWVENPNKAPGFTVFDPAREAVAAILSRIRKKMQEGYNIPLEKIHYCYLGPNGYPIGLNLLHKNGEPIDVIARNAAHLIKYAYSNSDTPRMDRLLENAILTLLHDKKPHNVLGIVPVLTDPDFLNRILPYLTDPMVREFWKLYKNEMTKEKNHTLDSLLNRLSPIRTNVTMRRM